MTNKEYLLKAFNLMLKLPPNDGKFCVIFGLHEFRLSMNAESVRTCIEDFIKDQPFDGWEIECERLDDIYFSFVVQGTVEFKRKV